MQKLYKNSANRMLPVDDKHEAEYYLMTVEEFDVLDKSLKELKRINKERSNANRRIDPKKERTGYMCLAYTTGTFKVNVEGETILTEARSLLLSTPYRGSFKYKLARNCILGDITMFLDKLNADLCIDKDFITSRDLYNSYFERNSDKTLFISDLELQRDGYWAVRIFANFTPSLDEEFLKEGIKK